MFDVAASFVGLIALTPLLLATAVLVRVSSPGPVLYRAQRVGRWGRPYTMYKFRTMHHETGEPGCRITSPCDDRVFRAGRWLRRTKLDELPQLWNVLIGQMSVVGPRPEDPGIVEEHYTPAMRDTLDVRPGLTSPGSIFGTSRGGQLLTEGNAESAYVERVLEVKLALEQFYVANRGFAYDLRIIGRTLNMLVKVAFGVHDLPEPPEMPYAMALLGGESSHQGNEEQSIAAIRSPASPDPYSSMARLGEV